MCSKYCIVWASRGRTESGPSQDRVRLRRLVLHTLPPHQLRLASEIDSPVRSGGSPTLKFITVLLTTRLTTLSYALDTPNNNRALLATPSQPATATCLQPPRPHEQHTHTATRFITSCAVVVSHQKVTHAHLRRRHSRLTAAAGCWHQHTAAAPRGDAYYQVISLPGVRRLGVLVDALGRALA